MRQLSLGNKPLKVWPPLTLSGFGLKPKQKQRFLRLRCFCFWQDSKTNLANFFQDWSILFGLNVCWSEFWKLSRFKTSNQNLQTKQNRSKSSKSSKWHQRCDFVGFWKPGHQIWFGAKWSPIDPNGSKPRFGDHVFPIKLCEKKSCFLVKIGKFSRHQKTWGETKKSPPQNRVGIESGPHKTRCPTRFCVDVSFLSSKLFKLFKL